MLRLLVGAIFVLRSGSVDLLVRFEVSESL